jgi:hypothetical protein
MFRGAFVFGPAPGKAADVQVRLALLRLVVFRPAEFVEMGDQAGQG